ncbi:MAG: excinuclease ABC subunit UvrC [Eubacteriales bacterium]|nr:excinuclease ABC subunit UvrC [Eubacteriales bacterium]
MNNDFIIEDELRKLPKKPGVYLMHGQKDEIIYIGKAVNLYNRVHQYFQSPKGKSVTIQKMITQIKRFEYIVVDSELEALVLENNLIKEHRPKYNTLLKDDKTYPYIKVTTNEAYPRLISTRKFKKDKARYFGPYTSGLAVKECIDMLHKLYKIRTCQRRLPEDIGRERPCLYYSLGQCMGPCNGGVTPEEYGKGIEDTIDFLSGKYDKVKKLLTDKMQACSDNFEFEKAIEYRDLLKAVEELSVKQKVTAYDEDDRDIIGIYKEDRDAVANIFFIRGGRMTGREHYHMDIEGDETIEELVGAFIARFYTGTPYVPKEIWTQCDFPERTLTEKWLSGLQNHKCTIMAPKKGQKEKLVEMAVTNSKLIHHADGEKLKKENLRTLGALNEIRDLLGLKVIHRVESFDISNTNGFDSVASMIVFFDGQPKNSDYRKFRIKEVVGPDDYASMREVLTRRFTHDKKDKSFDVYPDLILMDGGKGQVGVAEEVIEKLGLVIPVAGMVKDDRHRTRGLIFKGEEIPIDQHSEGFKLITRIQDETHRFAIEYHRHLRTKEQVHSILDDIPGIGPKRRRALMRAFKDIESIRNADLETLKNVEGMDVRSAQSVMDFLHTNVINS